MKIFQSYRGRTYFCSQSLALSNRQSSSASPSPSSNYSDHQMHDHILASSRFSLDFTTATKTHARIVRSGCGSNPKTLAALISTYFHCGCLNLVDKLIEQIFGGSNSLVINNIIIKCLMESGDYHIAQKIFCKMPTKDVVTWNSLITGLTKNDHSEEALASFNSMLNHGVEPDGFTFASAITSCARLGVLSYAYRIHKLMSEKGIELNYILSSALIDMYSKCGKIESAREIFDNVPHGDVSVWNAMINGLAIHGCASDAISIFLQMEAEKVIPDSITFVEILTACSHCRMVNEGRKYFDLMRTHYSILPQLEHYGALADMLARAGLLDEAYNVIKGMPMEPDIVIWRALLSGCRVFKKPQLGEVAVANISRPDSGDFVLLSNTYCSLTRWDRAQQLRETMKRKGVHKNSGKSWIELAGIIHHFKAGDRSHHETEAIYKVLEGLIQQTKLAGFVPSTDLVLMDVSEEEREENLTFHSEKLAVAYGILKSSPGTEIMVFKNLRICNDCHCWIKLVSRLLRRVIVVRDRLRFHRFEGGLCSCREFW